MLHMLFILKNKSKLKTSFLTLGKRVSAILAFIAINVIMTVMTVMTRINQINCHNISK
jgi:hypothetical protein